MMIEAVASEPFVAITEAAPANLVGTIGVQVQDAMGTVVIARTTANIAEIPQEGTGIYRWSAPVAPVLRGAYVVIWDTGGPDPIFQTELMTVVAAYQLPAGGLEVQADLTDLMVLVPWARRACEGPYGAPEGRPSLEDEQLYPMIADACSEIILFSGSLFGHSLSVKARHPQAGYPIAWNTDAVLNQWEDAVIICQLALDYWRFLFRDLKVSQAIKNEGTEWQYSLSANVIRDYLATLQAERDNALKGLRYHNPVLDRYASNIRVRDQATVAVLEWWDTNAADRGGAGMPGGQEAATIPWTPGWSGPGFTP